MSIPVGFGVAGLIDGVARDLVFAVDDQDEGTKMCIRDSLLEVGRQKPPLMMSTILQALSMKVSFTICFSFISFNDCAFLYVFYVRFLVSCIRQLAMSHRILLLKLLEQLIHENVVTIKPDLAQHIAGFSVAEMISDKVLFLFCSFFLTHSLAGHSSRVAAVGMSYSCLIGWALSRSML
jgi:hypothetical protein